MLESTGRLQRPGQERVVFQASRLLSSNSRASTVVRGVPGHDRDCCPEPSGFASRRRLAKVPMARQKNRQSVGFALAGSNVTFLARRTVCAERLSTRTGSTTARRARELLAAMLLSAVLPLSPFASATTPDDVTTVVVLTPDNA